MISGFDHLWNFGICGSSCWEVHDCDRWPRADRKHARGTPSLQGGFAELPFSLCLSHSVPLVHECTNLCNVQASFNVLSFAPDLAKLSAKDQKKEKQFIQLLQDVLQTPLHLIAYGYGGRPSTASTLLLLALCLLLALGLLLPLGLLLALCLLLPLR